MSLRKNIIANYASQAYVTIIGIVMVPLYIRYMGTEAFGLVGFFAMLQSWFQLLDIGLTPTMSRETARFNAGVVSPGQLSDLLRTLECVFYGVALIGAAGIAVSAPMISSKWLTVQHLDMDAVSKAIVMMGFTIGLRWISGLYRGVVNGFEKLVSLSIFNSVLATARFVVVIPLLFYVSTSVVTFFGYQLILAFIEFGFLLGWSRRLLPKRERSNWKWSVDSSLLRFALSIAFTGAVWVVVTQSDKLILSKLLSLTEYASFTLAITVAGGITIISGPISSALLPRLTALVANNQEVELLGLYRRTTQLVGALTIPVTVVFAFFSEQIIRAWTGDDMIARQAAPILTLYAIGNGILALAAFPYYLQYAKGNLRFHLLGSALFVALLVPILIVATGQYGVVGAGYTWLGLNAAYFILWIPIVHRHFFRGLHGQWLSDLVPIVLMATSMGYLLHLIIHWPTGRLAITGLLATAGLAVMVAAALSITRVRTYLYLGGHALVKGRK